MQCPALRVLDARMRKGPAQPVVAGDKVMTRGFGHCGRQATHLGREHAAQAHAVSLPQPGAEDVADTIELVCKVTAVIWIAEERKYPCFVTLDERRSKLGLGREMVVDAGALDSDVACDLAEAAGMKTARAHARFRRIQDCFANIHFFHCPYLPEDRLLTLIAPVPSISISR